jgi:hypothetical protein
MRERLDEWDQYVRDQKYARTLRWNAEAGYVRGLMVATLGAVVVVALICWSVFAIL